MENNNKPGPLRFGIMCNGYQFPQWQADCILKLLSLENVRPALLIIDNDAFNYAAKLKDTLSLCHFKYLYWYLYYYLIVKHFSKADKKIRLYQELKKSEKIYCRTTRKGKYANYFCDEDIDKIKKRKLDFILRFSFGIVKGEILTVAKLGVWSFHHGDEKRYRGGPPGFWEIFKGEKITCAVLQKLSCTLDRGTILKKGYFKTIDFSYLRNREQCFLESSEWPLLAVKEVRQGRGELGEQTLPPNTPPHTYPGNMEMLRCQFLMIRKFITTKFANVFMLSQWNIGVVDMPIREFLQPEKQKKSSPEIHWLQGHGKESFYADPFPVLHDGKIYIFFEELKYREGRGFISSVTFNGSTFQDYRQLLKLPQHMSYPYPVKYQNEYYFIPEICESGNVNVYKAADFPGGWHHLDVMIPGVAGVDSSLIEYGGRWWLFATDEKDGSSYKLKIWYAADFKGPWMPHAANPVKIDVRSSRPAGKPFVYEGKLYRPAQNYSEKNQGSISINMVTRLTTTEFAEEVVSEVFPFQQAVYNDAIHTMNGLGAKTVIDSRRRFFALGSVSGALYALQIIKNKLKQLRSKVLK